MNKYEITIITKEDAKDAPVKKEIETLGGKILNTSSLGQRQLVFPIKKEAAGFYTVVNFEIEPTKVVELNQKLGLNQDILRHLILQGTAQKLQKEEAKPGKTEAARKEIALAEEPIKPELAIVEEKPEVLPAKIEKEEKPAEEPKEKIEKPAAKPKKTPEKKEKPAKKTQPEAEKPAKAVEIVEPKVSPAAKEIEAEEMSSEERLKALDKKLDELLKE